MWTFVDNDSVDPTNNHAERELRRFVLWRKRSFGTKSDRGDRFAERMMTVTQMIRKSAGNSVLIEVDRQFLTTPADFKWMTGV